MGRFWILMAFVIATTVGLFLVTALDEARTPKAPPQTIAGMPVACIGVSEEDEFPTGGPCWITVGGIGVIVLGFGVGLVEFGFVGVGILFGVGQAAGGLIAMGQVGIGIVFFAGQAGLGLTGVAQGMAGWRVVYQGGQIGDGERFMKGLASDAKDLFSFK